MIRHPETEAELRDELRRVVSERLALQIRLAWVVREEERIRTHLESASEEGS